VLTSSYSWQYSEVTQGNGIPAQGNPSPASLFLDHKIDSFDGCNYDPSYGKKSATLQDILNDIQGFYQGPGALPIGGATGILFNKFTPTILNMSFSNQSYP